MGHALTVKGQVTIPKAMREHMGVVQGQELRFIPQPNRQVLMSPVEKKMPVTNAFAKWRGTGILKKSTEEILRQTRGNDCMR
jgi:antitoxin PrlF